ncbi:hypothetical protein FKM82_026380 [Ascaphus truei]
MINIRLENQTISHEFFLLGFSDFPEFRYILFLLFSLIYLMTLTGNLLILGLIHSDSRLHTPMYFFLGNLACLDAGSSSVTVPRMLADLLTEIRTISLMACRAQVFFFIFFSCSEIFLLAGMSYDRYVAICHPLHYSHIMSWELSCTDTFINILTIFLAALFIALPALLITFIPYIHISRTILRIPTKEGKHKAFSTCASHLLRNKDLKGALRNTLHKHFHIGTDIRQSL